ncbi:MAG: hypothetical protein AAF960_04540 [Bacteroidota bacterium]
MKTLSKDLLIEVNGGIGTQQRKASQAAIHANKSGGCNCNSAYAAGGILGWILGKLR